MKFQKMMAGEYGFEINGRKFVAVRNIAGFAHRDWDLYEGDHIVADQLATRAECVEAARDLITKTVAFQSAVKELLA